MTPVEEIKERLNIVELVSEYVQLKNMGANHKGLCPFHNEKSPSFTVSESKQFFHCFGCGKGGDVFTFTQEIEGVEFPEALRMLAKRTGVELKQVNPKEENKKTRLLDALKDASEFFVFNQKNTTEAKNAREYITRRGVTNETAELFQIGYALDSWDALMNALKKKGFTERELNEAGLTAQSAKTGKFYDRFRNRVMFPIHNAHGNVVGFSARTLSESDKEAKYINTPQTSIYNKSAVLYGLHLAKKYIQKMNAAVIVEGQMDVVSAHQAKFRNVVASSGTALTEEQVRLLKRYSDNIILAFDSDAAGVKAAWRGMQIAIKAGMNIKVMSMPEGEDADSLIRKSPEEFRKRAVEAKPFMEYAFDRILAPLDLSNVHHKKTAAAELLPMIALFPDEIEQTHYTSLLSQLLGVQAGILQQRIQESKQKTPRRMSGTERSRQTTGKNEVPSQAASSAEHKKDAVEQLSERLIMLIMKQPQDMQLVVERMKAEMISPAVEGVYNELLSLYNQSGTLTSVAPVFNNESLRRKWLELELRADEFYANFTVEQRQQELLTVMESLERSYIKQRLSAVQQQLALAEQQRDQAKIDSLSEEVTQLTELLKSIG